MAATRRAGRSGAGHLQPQALRRHDGSRGGALAACAGAWTRMRPLPGGIASRRVVTTLGDGSAGATLPARCGSWQQRLPSRLNGGKVVNKRCAGSMEATKAVVVTPEAWTSAQACHCDCRCSAAATLARLGCRQSLGFSRQQHMNKTHATRLAPRFVRVCSITAC